MKNIFILLSVTLIFSCSNTDETTNKEARLVTYFLNNTSSLEDYVEKGKNPIADFIEEAINSADKSSSLNKDNINDLLTEAKDYKHCIITTGDHTIVKITDLENCKQSGSWGACMPHAEGYIKKGELVYQEDYINNIIGRPDDQERMLFLFN